jgi:hypothetical protein
MDLSGRLRKPYQKVQSSGSITVVVTAAARARLPLADDISEAEYECERGDANEQSHAR